jgi:rsbT co-antagonist protein RsbR
MPKVDSIERLKIDDRDVARRRALFRLADGDLATLAGMRPFAEEQMDSIVEEFYELLLGEPETRELLHDEQTVRRLKGLQKRYFLGLFEGRCDRAYVEDRVRVGVAHERVGLSLRWYIAAYRHYLGILHARIYARYQPAEANGAYQALVKLVMFDMALAADTYHAIQLDTLARHQQAIRELSTPVIRLYDRLLLMPIVGTIDSHRAEQVMETLLVRVVEEQARVVILDIAGVALVDTQVADYLLKTTAAVRLLGARTILTGISAQVARTIVELGVDITAMHTLSRLADGLEFGLRLLGTQIGGEQTA